MAARSKTRKPKLVAYTPALQGDMMGLLAEVEERVAEGDTIALAIIEIRRQGNIDTIRIGDEHGFRHSLLAGTSYLQADLMRADED